MLERPFTTPVVLLIFNRPETTAQVFAAIRAVRPATLLVVADGPRPDRAGEAERCAVARAIVEQVDWPCEVLRNYADINLGCRRRVSSGLDWVFAQVPEAIILEDDCVPHPTFFRFCTELLDLYREDERIMHISGDNFQEGVNTGRESYYFSRYAHVWGWATWRRAWRHYDVDMRQWADFRARRLLANVLEDTAEVRYWDVKLESVARGQLDTWDVQWMFACWAHGGLSVLPHQNLVTNIGFGHGATHTRFKSRLAARPLRAMEFPLRHPNFVVRNRQADAYTGRWQFTSNPLTKLLSRLKLA